MFAAITILDPKPETISVDLARHMKCVNTMIRQNGNTVFVEVPFEHLDFMAISLEEAARKIREIAKDLEDKRQGQEGASA